MMTSDTASVDEGAATEAAQRANFSQIRYAQCWEDADVLLAGLDIREGDVCLSIASAGDNSFSMLASNPAKVIAIDLNPAQLACVELRRVAYGVLEHGELLELIGSRASDRRRHLYNRCRGDLPDEVRRFWDSHQEQIEAGIGSAGKFERYFSIFRTRILPWIHNRHAVDELLNGGPLDRRRQFYDHTWNTWRWRLLFKMFFSRRIMGRFGRDPAFFRYVEGSVSRRILGRAHHALTELDPADNPYLQWILTGNHTTALPHALRAENFDRIRNNLDRLHIHRCSVEQYLAEHAEVRVNRFNLSDIFEYMSEENFRALLRTVLAHSNKGARLAYWNMLVPRSRPQDFADRLLQLNELSGQLHLQDKAFFYSRFVVEEVA